MLRDADTTERAPTRWPDATRGVRIARADWLDAVRTLEPHSVDLLYVDPPFNTGQPRRGDAGAFADRWPRPEAHLAWLRERLEASVAALRPTGSMLIHVDWRTSHRVRLLLDELMGEDRFVNHLIWRYGLGGSSPRRFARKHDDILFYCLDPERYWFEPPLVPATSRRMHGQMKKATDVLDVPSINNMASERVGWPTQKPVALLELLVGACCPPDGLVLDPCCGSGTTLVAALRLGRRGLGLDIDPRAVALASQRLRASADQHLAQGASS